MKNLARCALLLVLVLVVVSAYLRLNHSGIGCDGFPGCYGQIGQAAPDEPNLARSAYARIVAESRAPLAWAAPLHRLVASLLGLAVLGLNLFALKSRRHRVVCLSLLALTVFLAILGLESGGLHHPGVVVGNLLGGVAMTGILGWLVFQFEGGASKYTETRIRHLRTPVSIALFLLCLQILFGALTSANFAATACASVPDCNGQWLPDATIYSALRIDQPHEISPDGFAVGGLERASIHQAHRVLGALVLAFTVIVAILAMRSIEPLRKWGLAALLLVLLEFTVGVSAVMTDLPISLALTHNWLAVILLLVLVRMRTLTHEKWWFDSIRWTNPDDLST